MAQPIKYNTGSKTTGCCLRKGNYDIGVVSTYQYGPTSGTSFWAGYDVPSTGFVSYQNKASQGPSIYEIPTINDLVSYGKNLNLGGTYNTAEAVVSACSSINTVALVNIDYPELPKIDNLLLNLDVGYTASYPWMGTNWFSVAGGTITSANIIGGATFNLGNASQNYSDSFLNMDSGGAGGQYAECNAFPSALQEFTINVFMNPQGSSTFGPDIVVVGQISKTQTNCNFTIQGNNSTGFNGVIILGGTSYQVSFGAVPINQWTMLTFTFDSANELKAYKDGGFYAGTPGPTGSLVSNGLKTIIGGNDLGVPATNPSTYNGFINFVNIWDTALNSDEITNLYNSYYDQRALN